MNIFHISSRKADISITSILPRQRRQAADSGRTAPLYFRGDVPDEIDLRSLRPVRPLIANESAELARYEP
jgi:hypothetical protein